MNDVVIVSGVRTPIGSFGGALSNVLVVELGSLVIREVLKRVNLRPVINEQMKQISPDKLKDRGMIALEKSYDKWDRALMPITIDEVIMGNVLQTGQGQNPARQAMIIAGIPKETPAYAINKVCASGLQSIAIGALSIMSGQAEAVIAGGQENMSLAPMAMPKARWGHRMELSGVGEVTDLVVFDGIFEIFYGYHMGVTAENIAELYNISRKEQDELGVLSHTRALTAVKNGVFAEEIVPVVIRSAKGKTIVDTDERPMETSMEKMGKLKPVFKQDGTVTAGNASGVNDAAAAVLLMSGRKAKEMGLSPFAKIIGFASAGIDPAYMGLGPIPAVRKVLADAGMTLKDIEMMELNEAFAAQTIGCVREFDMDIEFPNKLGSGISLGHPIGCTGARQVVTGLHQMRREGYNTGITTMCIGGGMGMAMLFERM